METKKIKKSSNIESDAKKLEDFIADEKAYRDAESSEIRGLLEGHGFYLKKSEKEFEKYYIAISRAKKEISEKVKELEKTKAEITSYTLQLISIIVAFLAIIFTVIFIGLKPNLTNFTNWITFFVASLVFILLAWFIIWLFKNKNSSNKQMSIASEPIKSDYKARKYLLLGILLGGLFGFIGSFTWGSYFWAKENSNDEWMFYFGCIVFAIVGVSIGWAINKLDKK